MKIPLDSTATLVAYPPTYLAVSGVTVRIQTPAVTRPAVGDAAVAEADTLSALTNADAAVGSDKLPFLAAPSVVPGRSYILETPDGEVLPVDVVKANSDETITISQPLTLAVPLGSTLRGWAITHDLEAAETASAGKASALWSYAIGGIKAPVQPQAFEVVRRSSGFALTWSELTKRMPHLEIELPNHDADGTETIEAAWMQHVIPALESRGLRASYIVSQEPLKVVHAAAVAYLLFPRDETLKAEFYEKLDQVLKGRSFWYDDGEGEAEALVEVTDGNGAQFVGVRLVR